MLARLREEVRQVIVASAHPTVREDLVELLGRPGYALHPDGLCRAGHLALEVHGAVTKEPAGRAAFVAAAAVELQMEAAYVFDEVADTASYAKRNEDLALAITLLTAGAAAAVKAAGSSPDPSATLNYFCTAYSAACAGQFLDGELQRRGGATLEEALQATCLKSGGLGRFATGFAARVAGVDVDEVELFDRLGSHIFTFAQLVDDLRDAWAPGQASDLLQGKATLPVVFYSQEVGSLAAGSGMLSPAIRRTYEASGAPLYVAIIAQAYMSRAQKDLSLLAQRGYVVGGLVRFLQSLDSGAGETLSVARGSVVA